MTLIEADKHQISRYQTYPAETRARPDKKPTKTRSELVEKTADQFKRPMMVDI